MMDTTDSASPQAESSAATETAAPPNSSRTSRPHRTRRGFAAGKSRLSLNLDDCAGDAASATGQSTPASTSSSCSSDVVPWWEVEYRCPPPGHLGAHVVPVSVGDVSSVEEELSTATRPTASASQMTSNAIRAGRVMYETPERARRNKLAAIRSAVPCLLVDSSPSQKRKMRSQDPADLLSTHAAKEFKRFHAASCSSLKKPTLPSRVVTPNTLVQPLTQIAISQTPRLKAGEKPHTETAAP